MSFSLLYAGYLAFVLPYLAIVVVLLHNSVRRARLRHGKNLGKIDPALCSTSAALAAMLLLGQTFYRPSIAHVAEARQQIDLDEDDSGDPEHPDKALHRQLKRIRRGEMVGDLILRM